MRSIFKREKGQKYKNKKIEIDGIKFDSTKEGKRYLVLKQALYDGKIQDLKLQVKHELIPSIKEEYVEHLKTKDKVKTRTLQLPITYTCDFQYIKNGELVVEDVKASPKMAALDKVYLLKRKMMFALKGIKIKEVYKYDEDI